MLDFDALLAQNLIINVHIFIAFPPPSYLVKSFLSWLKKQNKKTKHPRTSGFCLQWERVKSAFIHSQVN